MAVFTDLSDDDRNEIAVAYGLGSLTSVIGIADGDTETTYLFQSYGKEFIVTLFESDVEPLELERAFRTMEMLFAAGIPCPRTFRTKTGDATISVSGKLVAVVSFVEGSQSELANAAKCADLGRRVAQIHRTLMRPNGLAMHSLPRGPIHGALWRNNVFFIGDEISGLINFRLRHDDVLIDELAEVLVHWTMREDGELDEGRATAVLSGYVSVRTLQQNECTCLPAFVLSAAAKHLATLGGEAVLLERVQKALLSAQKLMAPWMEGGP